METYAPADDELGGLTTVQHELVAFGGEVALVGGHIHRPERKEPLHPRSCRLVLTAFHRVLPQ